MTRCIQCTRCVRFGAEVAGMRELGATGRGENMEIGTYVEHAMKSEVSGNVIDICPVGALTSKPFRFTARAWELEQRPTISAHDCVGTNLNAHMRTGKVMRMVPRENSHINETWISDRDRFSYEGLYHADRVAKPLIKKNGAWQECDWQTAIEFAVTGLQKVITTNSADQVGALASPNATVEEFYLLQKIMRGMGSAHIDHRLRQTDFSDQDCFAGFPGFQISFAEMEQCDTIFLIGSNIQKEAPAAFLRLRKASRQGAKIIALNAVDYPFSFDVAEKCIAAPDEIALVLAGIAQALGMDVAANVAAKPFYATAAKQLQEGKKVCFILGNVAMNATHAALIRSLSLRIANKLGATLNLLTEGANTAGAWLAGAVPHRGVAIAKQGLHAKAMLQNPLKAYVLLNVEPELDCANPVAASAALEQAEFVVSLSLFKNSVIDQHANVILPIAAFTETSGSYAKSLQAAQPILEGDVAVVRVHSSLGLREGDVVAVKQQNNKVRLRVAIDDSLPTRGVYIAGGIAETTGLGELFGLVEIEK
jgi:NADH-quinone oxidoreductase subunit G